MISSLSSGSGALLLMSLMTLACLQLSATIPFYGTVFAFKPSKLMGSRPTLCRSSCRSIRTILNENRNADSQTDGRPTLPLPVLRDSNIKDVGLGAWVPIGSQTSLKGLCPTQVKVMGLDLVVWDSEDSSSDRNSDSNSNSNTQWSVMKDVCSHKLAPLSQGRVNRETNCIECPYHGWQFDGDGALTYVPQMEPEKKLSSALVEKASIEAYPVHVTGDLIWAFIPTSVHGESFPVDLLPEDYYHNGLRRDVESEANFAVVELPASYDFFMENGMDPSHFSFAHHGVVGNREDAMPFKIDVNPSNFTHVSFKTQYQRKGEFRERVYGIQRPFNLFTLEKDSSNNRWKPGIVALFVPIEEGRCRIFTTLGSKKLTKIPLPHWITHLLTLRLVEGDFILHGTEMAIRQGEYSNTENYITPTSADKGVIAFRRWWRKFGLSQAPPHTFGPASAQNLKSMPRHEYVNPWHAHTKSCSSCRRVLGRAKKLRKWSAALGTLSALGASAARRPYASMFTALLGLMVHLAGNRIVLELEGRSVSELPDRSIPLD